jgi:integral membrane protein
MRAALIRYRIMAYLVGTLLIVLVVIGLPLKYWYGNPDVVTWTAIPHGYLYMVLLITAIDLGRRARWSWLRLLLIALAGTVPFLSFVAERSATKDVRRKLAAAEPAPPAASQPVAIPQPDLPGPEVPSGPLGADHRDRA